MLTRIVPFTLIALMTLVQDIELRPKLVTGDKFRLEVTRTRKDSARPNMAASGRTPVDVQVISAGADGFVLDWVPGDTVFDNPQVMQDPNIGAAAQATRGMRFRIALTGDGEFNGLLNEAEVAPKLQAIVGSVVGELAIRLPWDQRKKFETMMAQVLSPAALISSATQDAQVYWGLYGAALTPGESVAVDLEQPNPLGGTPIPATFTVRMDAATASAATITTTTTYQKDALTRMTLELAQRAGAPIKPQDAAKIPPMQMADDGKYDFDRVSGLMKNVAINRRIVAGGQERLDGWIITLVESPKR
ncbi:MAG TPA: hypothetical protein VFR18_19525 [Terriglobia bacterium]|nr:hypothetical protein [Terriglobia bacterium]